MMNDFITIAIEVLILSLICVYLFHHLINDLRLYILALYRKCIKGECRKLCLFCKSYHVCRYEMGHETKYRQGYGDGYIAGYEDGKRDAKKKNEKGYHF